MNDLISRAELFNRLARVNTLAEAFGVIQRMPSSSELEDCRNELCLKCGQYRESHLGACYGCRWRRTE